MVTIAVMSASKKNTESHIAENSKARHDYFVEDTFEAGLVLEGWEVKSLRAGRAQLKESYVFMKNGEAFLLGAHFSPLPQASTHIHPDPIRTRKLLLKEKELSKLQRGMERDGYTIIPLNLHWRKKYAKLTIGLAKGKQKQDKRATLKERAWEREQGRLLKRK